MIVVLLGLAAGMSWGIADFLGGLQSRYLSALTVALWSQVAGGLALMLLIAILGEPLALSSLTWGVGAGLFYGAAITFLYRGLAVGVMSIVAPVSACGAVIPVFVALALGQVPSLLTTLGIAAAFSGAVVVSLQVGTTPRDLDRLRLALVLALGAAIGFGVFFVVLGQGSAVGGGSTLWVIVGARISSVTVIAAMIASSPQSLESGSVSWPGRRSGWVTAVGILDATGNTLFAYAAAQGNLGVAAVLSSLYPVATVLLGRIVLDERLTRVQSVGVILALSGVLLISAG